MTTPAKRMLVAGGDKDVRFFVKMALRGYQAGLIEASAGPECIEKAIKTHPDLIIMNYIMDEATGYEIAGQISSNPEIKKVPVIMIIPEGFDLAGDFPGVDDFLVSPFSSHQLLNTVKSVMGQKMFLRKKKDANPLQSPSAKKDMDKKKKILIADDDPDIIQLLQLILSGKYEVDVARTGRELIEKGLAAEYDLIVSDVIMPESSGWKSIKKLRDEGVRAPVIFNSGLVKDRDLYETLKPEGLSAFLLKPFNKKELLSKISEMI